VRSSFGRTAGWWVIGLALLVTAGCYWSKYDKLTRTHVELLLAMARKLAAVTRVEDGPPAAFGEYRYPLERARDFTRIVSRRFADRPSLTAFRAFTEAYEGVLTAAEALRDADDESRAALDRAQERLQAEAVTVLRALDVEARG
jgi:hypothetical protein